jgi:hypothetical protein
MLAVCRHSNPLVHSRDTQHLGEATVPFLIIFTLGYLFGGVSALVILGLTVAARQGERKQAAPPRVEKQT